MPFTKASLTFLAQLARHNDREWFTPRKQMFEEQVRQPMLALVEQLNHTLAEVAPAHVRAADKVLLRIYRDIRFGEDKRPYKSHLSAWWGHTSIPKAPGASTSGAGFYLHLSPKELLVAGGLFRPTPAQMLATRRQIAAEALEPEPGAITVRGLIEGKALRRLLPEFDGQPLTRVPKGFPPPPGLAVHPAEDLLRCRQWGVSIRMPAEEALGSTLQRDIAKRLRAAATLVNHLNVPLLTSERPRPMF